jgi:serine/threonine-protein kinase SRPK3
MAPTEAVDPERETSPPTEHAADPDSDDIEEGRDAYRPGGFHPVYIGDVYAGKYQVLNKIGFGVYSTVWLVKDLAAS